MRWLKVNYVNNGKSLQYYITSPIFWKPYNCRPRLSFHYFYFTIYDVSSFKEVACTAFKMKRI